MPNPTNEDLAMPTTEGELRHEVANIMSDAHKSGHWSCAEADCHIDGSPINRMMQLFATQADKARMDEHNRWKDVAEEIVRKHGIYTAVNYLNKRAAQLTRQTAMENTGGNDE